MGGWNHVQLDGSTMRYYTTRPEEANGAGVLVCMHGPGLDEFIQDICERLAPAGYTTIAPDLYHRLPQPVKDGWKKIKDPEALRDMAEAVEELKRMPEVDANRVVAIGFCMGGRLAFLHAANNPQLRAAVVFHGGNIMVAKDGLPSPFEQAGNIQAPVLGLFGADDDNPSADDVTKIDEELTRLGKVHEFHVYEGAAHAFLNFTRPEVFREEQAKDAWSKCVAWLRRYA